MTSKQNSSYRILAKYGFMIDGPQDSLTSLGRIPEKIDNETFKQWKERLFGDPAIKIFVYAPYLPSQQTKISTIIRESKGEYLNLIFRKFSSVKDKKAKKSIEETKKDIFNKLSTITKETLISIIEELQDEIELEPAVVSFFERYIDSTENDIKTEIILKDLMITYNSIVRRCREDMINQDLLKPERFDE